MTSVAVADAGADARLDLAVTGMTCAACAARIERSLNRLDGVRASVNYATESAVVSFDVRTNTARSLVGAVEAAGYGASVVRDEPEAEPSERRDASLTRAEQLRLRLMVCATLAAPVVALAMIEPLQFRNWQWLALTLAAPVATWGAYPFHRGALRTLRHGGATMDTLVSLGVLSAFGWSLWALFFGNAGRTNLHMHMSVGIARGTASSQIYLEVAAAVPVFILAGRYAEARAKSRSGSALRALLAHGAKEVTILQDGHERTVPIEQLEVGSDFVVRPGEKVASDGLVVAGASSVDNSLVTGESMPVEVRPGDPVIGGTMNADGVLTVRATRVGRDTALAQIGRLVNEAQAGKAKVQRLADRVSAVFVPTVVALSVTTAAVWLLTGHAATEAFTAAVAVLIIACPCALGLATPTALLVGTGRAAQLGIVIRGVEALESTRAVDTVVLDKTGTITTGEMSVVAMHGDDVLGLVGSLEANSEHPVARAIVRAHSAAASAVVGFVNHPGAGVSGVVDGVAVLAGTPEFVESQLGSLPNDLQRAVADERASGHTVVVVACDGVPRSVVAVADTAKSSSAAGIERLRAMGLRPILLTGDHEIVARLIAAQVGIDEVRAGLVPAGKVDAIRVLQAQGRTVAMIGDGINDAAALAQADLGIAMGSGTDVAIAASDLTLMRSDLHAAADAIALSRRTLAVIKANLFWAFAYNVAALPLAATGRLNPVIAGAAMAGSSVFVVTNSLRLRRFRGESPPSGRVLPLA